MERKYKNLCKPIKIGNVTFRNRMFSAPMSGAEITPECTIGPKSTAFYELRAKGGAAAVTVSELMVHPPTDASHAFHLNTQTVGSVASFTYTADAIKRHGAVPSVEFSHSGQYAGTYLLDKNKKDSIRFYNQLEKWCVDRKMKYVMFMGNIAHSKYKKDWIDKIQELTHWNRMKINRSSTRP